MIRTTPVGAIWRVGQRTCGWFSWLSTSQLKHRGNILLSACALYALLCFRSVQFLNTNISQGRVATWLRCNGTYSDVFFVSNFLLSLCAKEF